MLTENPKKKQRIRTFLAGGTASILATLFSHPFEVIKVNQQVGIDPELPKRRYTSIFITIRKIFKRDGLRGFWKGHTTTQLLGLLHGITLFCTYEESCRILAQTKLKNHKYKIIYLSGFLSGTASVMLFSPIDFINTRKMSDKLITTKYHSSSLLGHTKNIIKKHGFFGLYRGVFVNWVHVSNFVALKFYLYNRVCGYIYDHNSKYHNIKEIHTTTLVLCGAITGIISSILIFPLEVIKRRIQIRNSIRNQLMGKICFTVRTCTKYIYKTEGVRGFYKGITPSMLKSCVVTAIVFSCYDKVSLFLDYVLFDD